MSYSRDMSTTQEAFNLVTNTETVYMTREAAMAAGRRQAEAEEAARTLMAKRHPAYNIVRSGRHNDQISSMVPGWEVTYPTQCNGRMADLGYVASMGNGGSFFIHFDEVTGEPKGLEADMLTKAARERLLALRRDFRFQR